PWLATKWSISADGKSYTFNLRTDVKYHDGTAFDAASAKWNLDRYRNTKESLRLGELAPVDTVTAVDASTLKVDLKTPSAPFLSVLVDRSGMMLSQKTVEAGGAERRDRQGRAHGEDGLDPRVPGDRGHRVQQPRPEPLRGFHLQREALRAGGRLRDGPRRAPEQGARTGRRRRRLRPVRAVALL